ncbi:hypothetical protein ACJJIF_03045 [Microbulbifer sp. SSSA002]|uniref:hypothetical protein n=1 Tax=unclassified Microbulbifer TaxID=2619833 RepID=UPI00403953EE
MKNIIAGIMIGLVTGYLGTLIIGYSAAIAMPNFFKTLPSGSSPILWDILVIQSLNYGLLIFTFSFLAYKLVNLHPWATSAIAIIACEATLYFFHPSEYTLYAPHILALVLFSPLSALFSKKNTSTPHAT